MWKIISSKKLKEKIREAYQDGLREGAVHKSVAVALYKYDPCKVLHTVTRELNELDKNTWDHERVDRIKKILMTGLGSNT